MGFKRFSPGLLVTFVTLQALLDLLNQTGVEVILICITLIPTCSCGTAITGDYCVDKPFSAECSEDQVIMVTSAQYGRMAMSDCVTVDMGYIGCHTDVLRDMDRLCSGRHRCEFPITTELLGPNPCVDLTRYLKVTYSCVAVVNPHMGRCKGGNDLKLTSSAGYLASVVSRDSGCGAAASPWIIQAQSYQTVNFTLLDFTGRAIEADAAGSPCVTYATVEEVGKGKRYIVCGGSQRETHAYMSQTSKVRVTLNHLPEGEAGHFVLRYEAVGCKTPAYPGYIWVRRRGRLLTIGCVTSDQQWKLTCFNNVWHGRMHNCTSIHGLEIFDGASYMDGLLSNISNEVVISTIVTIAIFISVCIIAAGVIYIKRNQIPLGSEMMYNGGSAGDVELVDTSVPSVSKTVKPPNSPTRRPPPPIRSYE